MKIEFSKELFSTLKKDAGSKGKSIPSLVLQILKDHYNNSHIGVTNERERNTN